MFSRSKFVLSLAPMIFAAFLQAPVSYAQDGAYRLSPGDVIGVTVQNRPELSVKQTVGPDGKITVPLAGVIAVADLTREEASAAVEKSLAPYYTSVEADVEVDTYAPTRILLLGAVKTPGSQSFDSAPSLLDVIARGGGAARTGGDPTRTSLAAPVTPERCVIYRGTNTVMWVDVKKMLATGEGISSVQLRRGDVVYVPEQHDSSVSVMGMVNRPGNLDLSAGANVQTLLADAGGFTDRAGRNPTIRIVTPSTGATQKIAFNDLATPRGRDLALRPGDLVYVQSSTFNDLGYVIEKISPLVNVFTTAVIAR